jgi:hypothetical protein
VTGAVRAEDVGEGELEGRDPLADEYVEAV